MRHKNITAIMILSLNIMYSSNHQIIKKHEQLLKKTKKKAPTISLEEMHEQWNNEYIELEASASDDTNFPLELSPKISSEKSSLESFYEQEESELPKFIE